MMDNGVLSEREREVLRLVATGLANKEIATALSISPNTVKVHLRNIFEKIAAGSRTEAAMYAVREGLVEGLPGTPLLEAAALPAAPARPWWKSAWVWLGVGLALTIFAGAGVREWLRPRPAPNATLPSATASPAPSATPVSRWQVRAPMLTARSGLAAAAYENQIYAIGGETHEAVTGALERYDPSSDTWTALAPKPLPVADIGAAVIGGKIYVPGGRTADGAPTDALEIYDPLAGAWSLGTPMPAALSAYALAAFEGRLYLFGGWDGAQYVASVFAFDPDSGAWETRTPMPSARAYAGAAAAGGGIFVIGGSDGEGTLSANEMYLPSLEGERMAAWSRAAPLPASRSRMGVVSVADFIFVLGGEVSGKGRVLEYLHTQDVWQEIDDMQSDSWTDLGIAASGGELFGVGGLAHGSPSAQSTSYKAIFSLLIPGIP